MKKYLIDVNLPHKISLWKAANFTHQRDIQSNSSDIEIWDYAKRNNLIIITQDVDFLNRLKIIGSPPKVIKFQTGNIKFPLLNDLINDQWLEIEKLINNCDLVLVYKDRLEGF